MAYELLEAEPAGYEVLEPEQVDLLGEESRRIPGIQATTQGAPQRRQTGPEAFGGIAAQIQQEPLPSFSESLRPILPSHIGPEESLLAISPAGVATGAEITESTGIPKAVTIPVSGAGKAVAGLGQFLTSPAGIAQSATAMIPGVGILQRAKWIYDMAKGTGETAGSLYDRIAKIATSPEKTTTEEWQGLAEDAANTALMLYGAGKLSSHEVSALTGIRAPLGRALESKKARPSKDLAREINRAPLAAETIPLTQPIVVPDPRGEPIPGIAENAALMDAALREAQRRIVQPGQVPAIDLLRRQREDQIVPAGTAEPLAFEGGGEAPFGQVSYMRKAEAPLPERTQQALEREKQNATQERIIEENNIRERERVDAQRQTASPSSGDSTVRSAEGEGIPQQQPQAEVAAPKRRPDTPVPESEFPPLPPGNRVIDIQRTDGTTYRAAVNEKVEWPKEMLPPGIESGKAIHRIVLDSDGKPTWSTGFLDKGEKIVEKSQVDPAVDTAPKETAPVQKQTAAAVKEPWEMTRDEYKGDDYDKMIWRAARNGDITYEYAENNSRLDSSGNTQFWAKTRSQIESEGKSEVKRLRGLRAEGNKLKGSEAYASWRIRSNNRTAKADIESAINYSNGLLSVHKERVVEALNEGKPVPPEVLADYPDLKPAKPTERVQKQTAAAGGEEFLKAANASPKDIKNWPSPTKEGYEVVFRPYGEQGRGFYQKPIEQPAPPQPGIISGTVVESWATNRIAEGKNRLSSGIDPELMTAYAIKGAAYLERGIRDFAKWSDEMRKEFGEAIKPYLRSIYRQANNVFLTPGRYAVEGGKLKIVSEQEARQMERSVKLNRDVSKVKEQLDLFDKEIGDALTSGGKFLPKDMRPDVSKGAPAEKGTVTSKSINQYFVNQLVTVRKAMQKIRNELAATADTASIQYFDVLQKRFELSFRKVQELRRASHESLYFWNQIRAEYQDIARMAGETPNIKARKPIIDQLVKDIRERGYAKAGRNLVDYLRVNQFTPFSFTLDFTTNLLAVASHTPAWLGMDLAHLVTGKPITRTQTALRALKLAGQNAIPFREKFRLPEEIEVGLGTAAGGEFQGLPKEVMVDFSEILRENPKLASKLKNLDYVLGGPVRMKRAVDNFFGRFGATAELYNAAYQAGKAKKLKGDQLKEFVEQFVLNPPEGAIADAIRVGGEFKFNRELPEWAERFASNTITKLAVEAYPRWTLQFSKWAGEMVGVDPGFFRQVKQGSVSAERLASYLAKAATGWGALYAFNQLFYNQVDPNTMEYVNEKGERVRLSGRQPFPELYTLTALFRGDIKNAKAAFPYTSIPFAGMTGGQGGLLSPIIQTMIESWKGTYTAEQTARELTKMLNNAIPGKSVLGLIRALYDPTVREGVGAPIPGIAQSLPTKVNITTGEPAAPKQRIPGTGIMLPTVGGTPFPGAVRMLNPVEKTLMNHGISNIRPKRTSLIEMPASEVPKELRREYEQRTGQNVKAIIGEAIQSKEWKELDGKENFDIRRELLMNWMTLARSMARAELAEKYNKGMGAEKPVPLNVQRLPEFVKQLPAVQ